MLTWDSPVSLIRDPKPPDDVKAFSSRVRNSSVVTSNIRGKLLAIKLRALLELGENIFWSGSKHIILPTPPTF